MNISLTTAIAALVLATSFPAKSQLALETAFSGQPLIYTRDGKLHGCGVRIVSVDEPAQAGQPSLGIDASMQLDIALKNILIKVTARRVQFVNGKLDYTASRF